MIIKNFRAEFIRQPNSLSEFHLPEDSHSQHTHHHNHHHHVSNTHEHHHNSHHDNNHAQHGGQHHQGWIHNSYISLRIIDSFSRLLRF